MTLHERSQHLAGMWNARLIEWLFSAQNNNQMQETSWKPLTSSPAFSYLCLCAIDSVMRMRLRFSPGRKGKEKRRGDSEEMDKSGKAGIEEKERENVIQERKGREESRKGRMICGNRVLHLNRKIMKLIGLAAVRSLSLKNSLAIALVVTNKGLCSRSQLLFLPESGSSLDKLKSVSLKTTIKKKNPRHYSKWHWKVNWWLEFILKNQTQSLEKNETLGVSGLENLKLSGKKQNCEEGTSWMLCTLFK